MTPERSKKADELYHAALTHEPGKRAAFLDRASDGDEELRREIESRLARSGLRDAAQFAPGTLLGPYRVEALLGTGGMGQVYRASDTRLDRPVAIKFLSAGTGSASARRRFQQEAKTASSLNHRHILTVYEADEFEGRQYLATEFVEGGTLREWMLRTKPTRKQILELLSGVADGLACAHEAGILHRDVKPDNILVTKSGDAKLSDFGLAKLLETTEGELPAETLTESTLPGMVLGTVAYMSPEQALGQKMDARSDIFSFGVVLYELLAGRRPFTGATGPEVLQAIVNRTPDPLPEDVSMGLRMAVEKALEKDPAERYQSMREMVVDLRRLAKHKDDPKPVPSVAAVPRGPSRRRWLWSLPILFVTCTAVWLAGRSGWLKDASQSVNNPLVNARFTRLTDFEGTEMDGTISPDGNFVAFLSDRDGQFDVWLTRVGAGSPINLTPGKEDERTPLRSLGFSPDGSELWLAGVEGRRVRLLPLVGGAPRVFLEEQAVQPAWSPDGARLAYHRRDAGDPIYVADRSGANPRRIFTGRSGDWHNHYLVWSRDGRWIYFVHGIPASNEMDLWRIAPSGGEPERLTWHNSEMRDPTPLGPRTILYVARESDGSGPWLWAFDVERKATRRITYGLEKYTSVAASADGRRLVASVGDPSLSLWSVPLLDRVAEERDVKPYPLPTVRAWAPRFSGRQLYFLSSLGTGDGLWRYEDGRVIEIWKGAEGALLEPPAIAPDGRRIAIVLRKEGKRRIHVISADGAELQPVAPTIDAQGSTAWSPDGNWIATGGNDGIGEGLFKIPTAGGVHVRLTNKIGRNPIWSPDGSLIAYVGPNVYNLTPLLAVRPDGSPVELPPIRIHRDGERIRFLPNGQGLVYLHGSGAVPWEDFWLLDLATRRARQLTRLSTPATMRTFDVTPDGKQIVFDRLRQNSDIVLIDLPR